MKKIFAILTLGFASSAFAGGWVSVDVDSVKSRDGRSNSTAQFIRAGTELGGLKFGLQSRTARFDNSNLVNSLEVTVGKQVSIFTPFVGVAHDNGFNGRNPFNYGVVGVTAGVPVGPGFLLGGVKTRIRESDADPKQTVTFASYSYPLVKNVSLNFNAGYSAETIKERSLGMGLGFRF